MAGRMKHLDAFLGLTPSSSSKEQATVDFDRYLAAMDMLIQEMHHPRALLKKMRDEYSSWIERAQLELKHKQKRKTVESRIGGAWQHTESLSQGGNHADTASSEIQQNKYYSRDISSAKYRSRKTHHSSMKHPSALSVQGYSGPQGRKMSANLPRRPRSSTRQSSRTRKGRSRGSAMTSAAAAAAKRRNEAPSGDSQGSYSSSSNGRPKSGQIQETSKSTKYADNSIRDSLEPSTIPLEDYIYEELSMTPHCPGEWSPNFVQEGPGINSRDSSVQTKLEPKFWRRLIFPSKDPSNNANARYLLSWMEQKIVNMEAELEKDTDSSRPKSDVQNHHKSQLDKRLAAELPILGSVVKELSRQLRACLMDAKRKRGTLSKWQMESNDDLHISLLHELWHEFVKLMEDMALWSKAQQDNNDVIYANQIENIEAVKQAIAASTERLIVAKQRCKASSGKTDAMRRMLGQLEKKKRKLLRQYFECGKDVGEYHQQVQDLQRYDTVREKLNQGKIHMLLSTAELLLDEMNETIDNEPSNTFLFSSDEDEEDDEHDETNANASGNLSGRDEGPKTDCDDSGSPDNSEVEFEENWLQEEQREHENPEDQEKKLKSSGDGDSSDEYDSGDDGDDDFEQAPIVVPKVLVFREDIARLSELHKQVMELEHGVSLLMSRHSFHVRHNQSSQTDDMVIGALLMESQKISELKENEVRARSVAELAHEVFMKLWNLWTKHGVKPMHIFGRLDADGEGTIDQKEFRVGLRDHYKIDLTKEQVKAMFSYLGRTGKEGIDHKDLSRAIKRAGSGGLKSKGTLSRPSTKSGARPDKAVVSHAYEIPSSFRNLLLVVPPDYIPIDLALSVTHRLIWQLYAFAIQRLGKSNLRLPEIVFDYFVLNYNEAHAAEVRVVDFLTSVKSLAKGKSVRIDNFVHLLDRANDIASEDMAKSSTEDGRKGRRPPGSEEFRFFIGVMSQLQQHVGSVHGFIENNQSGLQMVETSTARLVIESQHSYKTAGDEVQKNVSSDLEKHSVTILNKDQSESLKMIGVDEFMFLAVSIWQNERKMVKLMLQDLFVSADENDDGYLTLDEFRKMVSQVDPKRSAMDITRIYREALSINPSAEGGLTPEAFATIGIKHGLLLQKKRIAETGQASIESIQPDTDSIMLSEMERAWAEQKDAFAEVCDGNTEMTKRIEEFEDALRAKNASLAMRLFGMIVEPHSEESLNGEAIQEKQQVL